MKKSIVLLTLVAAMLGYSHNTNAQNNNDRDGRRQEMQARMTERLISDLKLTDEQKPAFENIYKRYMEEMAATRTANREQQSGQDNNGKDLTDEEATARLNDVFARQAEQIQQSQLRLDIQKKYCAELSAVLTPQQLLRVFQPQQNRQQNRQRQGGPGGRGGFGGPRGGFGGQGGFGGGGGFGGPGGDF